MLCFYLVICAILVGAASGAVKRGSNMNRGSPQSNRVKSRGFRDSPPVEETNNHRKTQANTQVFPPCSENIFTDYGVLDLGKMVEVCSAKIPSSQLPPSFYYFNNVTKEYAPTLVRVQLVLNSLVNVDDIQSTYTIDYFWRILWEDERFILPDDAWDLINPEAAIEGVEISDMIRESKTAFFWLPDIFIFQSNSQEIVDELIKLLPDGRMFWSRHIVGKFNEPQMPFHNYPLDSQNFSITLQSFAYDSRFIELAYINNQAVVLSTDVQDSSTLGLEGNKLWDFDSYSSYIVVESFPSPTNSARTFYTAFVNLKFNRQYLGIVYRLGLPVMVFLVVVGASFWTNEEMRINIALQMLLMVSTLYIVIGRAIPFIGYLTLMDVYMISTFVILTGAIIIHFIMLNLHRKSDKYPLYIFIRDSMMLFFRTTWIPLSIAFFAICFFRPTYEHMDILLFTLFVSVAFGLYFLTKYDHTFFAFKTSSLKLRLKASLVKVGAIDQSTGKPMELTLLEQFFLHFTESMYKDKIYESLLFTEKDVDFMMSKDMEQDEDVLHARSLAAVSMSDYQLVKPTDDEAAVGKEGMEGGEGLSNQSLDITKPPLQLNRQDTMRSMNSVQSMYSTSPRHGCSVNYPLTTNFSDVRRYNSPRKYDTDNNEAFKLVLKSLDKQSSKNTQESGKFNRSDDEALTPYQKQAIFQYKQDTLASFNVVIPAHALGGIGRNKSDGHTVVSEGGVGVGAVHRSSALGGGI